MGMVESSITCDGEGLLLLGTSLVVVEDDIGYESSEAKHGGSWRAQHEGRRESEGWSGWRVRSIFCVESTYVPMSRVCCSRFQTV